MIRTSKSPQEQEAIVADYLLGTATYRQLGMKYDVDYRIIHSWVMKFQGKEKKKEKPSTSSSITRRIAFRKATNRTLKCHYRHC
jgi:transposase-like protein